MFWFELFSPLLLLHHHFLCVHTNDKVSSLPPSLRIYRVDDLELPPQLSVSYSCSSN